MTEFQIFFLVGASVVAGVVNSLAGGGTLFSFPAAIAAGLPSIVANATNAVAMTPGSLAAAWGYRRELKQDRNVAWLLTIPAVAGGLVGSLLLLATPQRIFDQSVPALVLLAAGLLLFQNLRQKPVSSDGSGPWVLPMRRSGALALQFLVGVYGGYFGAGMGIMTLAVLSMLGGTYIHRMNGVKILLGACVNGFASVAFLLAGAVDYPAFLLMTIGISLGGWGGAEMARRVNAEHARWVVVGLGLIIAAILAHRTWF